MIYRETTDRDVVSSISKYEARRAQKISVFSFQIVFRSSINTKRHKITKSAPKQCRDHFIRTCVCGVTDAQIVSTPHQVYAACEQMRRGLTKSLGIIGATSREPKTPTSEAKVPSVQTPEEGGSFQSGHATTTSSPSGPVSRTANNSAEKSKSSTPGSSLFSRKPSVTVSVAALPSAQTPQSDNPPPSAREMHENESLKEALAQIREAAIQAELIARQANVDPTDRHANVIASAYKRSRTRRRLEAEAAAENPFVMLGTWLGSLFGGDGEDTTTQQSGDVSADASPGTPAKALRTRTPFPSSASARADARFLISPSFRACLQKCHCLPVSHCHRCRLLPQQEPSKLHHQWMQVEQPRRTRQSRCSWISCNLYKPPKSDTAVHIRLESATESV
jgi:hypothetical protein